MRFLVSGVGRSATTLVYRQIGRALLSAGVTATFRYEPYLWNIRSPAMKGQSFGQVNLSAQGLAVHRATPLFLDAPGDPDHDRFLDRLFDAPLEADPARTPDAYLAKVIRGSGRLRAYLERFADLRVVACLRNPLDTVNSSLGMFSFFGEEFHADDRPRFKAELQARAAAGRGCPGIDPDALPEGRRSIEWAAAWAWAFTRETLDVAQDYPDRVHVLLHEEVSADAEAAMARLAPFLGVDGEGLRLGLGQAAGPRRSEVNLTVADLDRLLPVFDQFRRAVLEPRLGPARAAAIAAALPDRYGPGRYRLPLAGADAERMGPGMHEMMLLGETTPFARILRRAPHPTDLARLIDAVCTAPPGPETGTEAAAETGPQTPAVPARPEFWPVADPAALKRGRSFGVVITCYNSGLLAVEAVFSCLAQTLPFDEIVVVDDASTDDSPALLAELELRFAQVTLVRLDANVGPAAARHIGITRLGTDFVTQLDGDDLFWPTKLEGEARAIGGDLSRVAFSDILLAESPERSMIDSTTPYDGLSSRETYRKLVARVRPIPRDLTLARASYFAAGGYDLLGRLYEDWEFKTRLAALDGQSWHRADSYAGTVYNRATPGLSEGDLDRQARSLLTIFLRAQDAERLPQDEVLEAFDGALKRVSRRPVVKATRAWLARLIETGKFKADAVAAFGGSRWLNAMAAQDFNRLISDLSDAGMQPPLAPPRAAALHPALSWTVRNGYRPVTLEAASGERRFALDGADGVVEVSVSVPVSAFGLRTYLGPQRQRIRVDVEGLSHEQEVTCLTPGGANHITVPLPLHPGRSLVRIAVLDPVSGGAVHDPELVLGGLYAAEAER